MNLTVQNPLRQDARIQDLYFNISEMKLSITSLYIISDAPKYDIIWTENSDVINSFISEILKYKSYTCVLAQKILDREIRTEHSADRLDSPLPPHSHLLPALIENPRLRS